MYCCGENAARKTRPDGSTIQLNSLQDAQAPGSANANEASVAQEPPKKESGSGLRRRGQRAASNESGGGGASEDDGESDHDAKRR